MFSTHYLIWRMSAVLTAIEATEGLEAPMLAKMVAAGELPPVEKRLLDEPVVVGRQN